MNSNEQKSIKWPAIISVVSILATTFTIIYVFNREANSPISNLSPISSNQATVATPEPEADSSKLLESAARPSTVLQSTFPGVDFSKTSVEYAQVLSGGVGKDGIPAISNPTFDALSLTSIGDDVQGILVSVDGEHRFYPYNILVSHEIVNDSIGDTDFAVTFCPLCGSAVVFDRNIAGRTVEFGVSGFLFESNLLMYDRSEDPTLWSQALGSGIIGTNAGAALEILPMQLLTVAEAKKVQPGAKILSTNTGFSRSYDSNPYGDYDNEEGLKFPVSVQDRRFFSKEIFFVIPQGDDSIALRISELESDTVATLDNPSLTAAKSTNNEITVTNSDGEVLPGYYEMWFSWATHHQENGIVWEPNK